MARAQDILSVIRPLTTAKQGHRPANEDEKLALPHIEEMIGHELFGVLPAGDIKLDRDSAD